MKFFKKVFCIILAVAAITALTGCTQIKIEGPLSEDVLLTVNDEVCTTAEGIFRLMQVKDSYHPENDELFWYRAIGDTTMDQYIKDSVRDELIRDTASVLIADKMALYLTDDEQNAINSAAYAAYETISREHDLAKFGITVDSVLALYLKQAMYEKVYNTLSDDVKISISDADTKVIEVNYVMIPIDVSFDSIEELRSEIRSGTDFQTACLQAGYEPVMDVVLKKGDMSEAFEKIAYALQDGEISEIVENGDSYYIIQCKEDYLVTESAANNNKVITDVRKERFDSEYDSFAKTAYMRFNSDVWNNIAVDEI